MKTKIKEYLKTLGIITVMLPLSIISLCMTFTGCIIKSVGFLAMLDYNSAYREIESFIHS